jgi:hypothetical protein
VAPRIRNRRLARFDLCDERKPAKMDGLPPFVSSEAPEVPADLARGGRPGRGECVGSIQCGVARGAPDRRFGESRRFRHRFRGRRAWLIRDILLLCPGRQHQRAVGLSGYRGGHGEQVVS